MEVERVNWRQVPAYGYYILDFFAIIVTTWRMSETRHRLNHRIVDWADRMQMRADCRYCKEGFRL